MTISSGTSALIARTPSWTIPSGSYASLPASSLRAGIPNRSTAGTPAAYAVAAVATRPSMPWWCWPGIDSISVEAPPPWRTKSGWIMSAGESRVSCTIRRIPGERRNLRRRVVGKGMIRV